MKKKAKKLVLAKETVRSMGAVVGGTNETYTCGNTCSVCPASRQIACFNSQQASCTC